MLVLLGAVFLFLGVWSGTARPVFVSVVSSAGALLLVGVGATRTSRPPEGDGHG